MLTLPLVVFVITFRVTGRLNLGFRPSKLVGVRPMMKTFRRKGRLSPRTVALMCRLSLPMVVLGRLITKACPLVTGWKLILILILMLLMFRMAEEHSCATTYLRQETDGKKEGKQ